MNRRALLLMPFMAFAGTAACSTAPAVRATPDDARCDAVWSAIARGDLEAANLAAEAVEDPELHERARLDVVAAIAGRGAACVQALDAGSWLAARYEASGERARDRLREERRRDAPSAAVWIEEARRSAESGRALSAARAAQPLAPGGVEALAIEAELLAGQRRYPDVEELLATPLDGARLRLARARLAAGTGRLDAACRLLLADVREGYAVPSSLALLQDILVAVPQQELEREALATLLAAPSRGARMERARLRLLAVLHARRGDLSGAIETISRLDLPAPDDEALRATWIAQREGRQPPAPSLELRVAADADRTQSLVLRELRLLEEWDLAARQSYDDHDEGRGPDLDGLVARLDAAAAPLGDVPRLAPLPRRDFGLFAEMLDVEPLRQTLPDAVVLCGKPVTMPADIAAFERVDCAARALPDGVSSYEQCHVRRPRVTGYLASRGAAITGAGIDPLVWIDLDELGRQAWADRLAPRGPPLPARPATGRAERLDLSEPLDVARWIEDAALDVGLGRYNAFRLDALEQHEQQHILDFREFDAEGVAGKLGMLLSGGVFPAAVQAEVERRAQLRALRNAADPRLALAHALSYLPVEGAARSEAHAVGYEALIAEFVRRLDDASWPEARTVEELGLDRRRNLVQQLWKLDAETIRSIALGMDD